MSPDARIEIVHVVTSLETGGAQRMLEKLVAGMDPARFRSQVVSLIDGGPIAERLRALGIEARGLSMRPGVPDPRAIGRLAKLLRAWRPAILQTWLYHADLVGTLAAGRARVPHLLWNLRCTLHEERGRSLSARVAPWLCARLSPRPEVIIANSRAGRRSHERIGYRARRWVHLPNGFDLTRFRPDSLARSRLLAELGLPQDAILAGMFARFHPMKGHAALLGIAARLAGELPRLHFVLVGAGVAGEDPRFAALLARGSDAARVHALGERRDVPELMAAVDFLISASSSGEGFPNVLGEALACATPCVATDVGDSAEIVGAAGILVPARDEAALEAAILRMARLPPGERDRLGTLGRARVAEHYEIGGVVRAYEGLYAELARATGGGTGGIGGSGA